MAIPSNVMRLAITGTFPLGEIWNHSYWWTPSGLGTGIPTTNSEAMDTLAAMLAESAWTTYRDTLKTYFPSDSSLTGVHLYCYPTGGPTADAIAEQSLSVAGTGSGSALPLQCSLVASLRTNESGRSRRGRVYLPTVSLTLPANHQTSSTITTVTAQMVADFLDGYVLSSVLPNDQGLLPVVVSSKLTAFTVIEQIVVDSIVDIQRRRRNREDASFRAVVSRS